MHVNENEVTGYDNVDNAPNTCGSVISLVCFKKIIFLEKLTFTKGFYDCLCQRFGQALPPRSFYNIAMSIPDISVPDKTVPGSVINSYRKTPFG